MDTGVVLATCTSPRGGVPKFVQPRVRVHADGLEGDHHRGATRYSRAQRRVVPNERTVTVCAMEDYDALRAALGIALYPGDFAENFLVRGLGTLAGVLPGERLVLAQPGSPGTRVTLRVVEHNLPCRTLLKYHADLVRAATNQVGDRREPRRGLLCVVEAIEGDGVLAMGASVTRVPRGSR